MTQPITVPGLLVAGAGDVPDTPLVLEKRLGKWTERTRAGILAEVTELAFGLEDLGLRAGDRALVLLASQTTWITTDLALQALGVQVASAPPTVRPAELDHLLRDCRPRLVLVQDQAGADAVLASMQEHGADGLDHVVYVNPAGVAEYENPLLAGYDALRDRGRAVGDGRDLNTLLERLDDDETAVLNYDYGVAGARQAVQLTHRALVAGARSTADVLQYGPRDRVLVAREFADPVDRGVTLYPALAAGALLVLPENAATVNHATAETAPTCLHYTLRRAKDVAAEVRVRMQSSRGVKGLILRTWYRRFRRAIAEDRVTPPRGVWRALVAYPVIEKLGLDKARQVVVTGDHVPREAVLYFRALGVRLVPAYALPVLSGLASIDLAAEGEDLGPTVPGVELRVSQGGELLVRGDQAAVRAHGDTAGPDPDGWWHTGDVGHVDEQGHVTVSHRRGEELRLADGTHVSRDGLETDLRASPYVRDAALVEIDDDDVVVVLELMESTVERWATRHRVPFTTFRSLSRRDEVRELAQRVVDRAAGRHEALTVDDVVILDIGLDAVPSALLPTGRARRSSMLELGATARARDGDERDRPEERMPVR